MTLEPKLLLTPHDGGTSWELGSRITCKVASKDVNNAYCVLEVVLPPGVGSPLHIHRREDEILYVVSGECEIRSRDATTILQAGGAAVLPKNAAHAFRNSGSTPSTVLITAVPGGLDGSFAETAELIAREEWTEENALALNQRYDVEIISA